MTKIKDFIIYYIYEVIKQLTAYSLIKRKKIFALDETVSC